MKCMRSVLCGLGLLLAVAATPAQETRVKAQIPFDFMVGNRVLPAGEYAVVPQGEAGQAVWILATSKDSKAAALSITNACANSGPSDSTKLVFHVVDGRYFLSQIWTRGYEQGRQLPKSKTETQLAKNNSSTNVLVLAENLTH